MSTLGRATFPIKVHYTLEQAGFAAYTTFISVILRERGINSTFTGTIYLASTIFSLVAKPFFGAFADRYRNIQLLLCIWLGIAILSFSAINFAPRVQEPETTHRNETSNILTIEDNKTTSVDSYHHYATQWPFWIYVVAVILGNVAFAVINSFSDTICFFVLHKHQAPQSFGVQRLWGTVGWGICSVTAGFLVDFFHFSGNNFYTPALIVATVCLIADAVVAYWFIDISFLKETANEPRSQKHIAKQVVFVVLSKAEVILLLVDVAMAGTFTTIIWVYQFWLLGDLGADTTMMGLAASVRNFLGELPFFIVSGYIISRLGHGVTMKVAIVLLAVAELLYSVFKLVYLCYIAEVLVGFALAAFFTTMPSYAASVAPPGTETTVQGLVGAFFEGIGGILGSLYGGIGFEYFGGRWMIRVLSLTGIAICLSTSLLSCICVKKISCDLTDSTVSDNRITKRLQAQN